jgi:hypothetical protein
VNSDNACPPLAPGENYAPLVPATRNIAEASLRDMHGKLPFPEATATTEILVTGEKRARGRGCAWPRWGSG